MTQNKILEEVKLESIFHPSDFSEASEVAFAHALRIALVVEAKLTMLHIEASPTTEWQDFPGVRETLERWGLIPADSPKSAVGQLGIDVTKFIRQSEDPVEACLHFLAENPAELIVLAVRQREGRMRWLERSVGGPIARRAGQMTLLIPHGVDGFVSRQDGSISVRNILIPVTTKPRPQPSVEATAQNQLNGLASAAEALGNSTNRQVNRELKSVKKRVLSAAGRAAKIKGAKKRWAKVRKQAKKAVG